MDYIYDLVSGNTNGMRYQYGAPDYLEHKYEYDADNRLKWVSTTRDGLSWDNDAKYHYYIHGPLGRTEIGQNKVQGMDYAYTINGWLKGMNSAALTEQVEQGQDGKVTNLSTQPYWNATYNNMHQWTGRDAFGYAIGYFGDDTLSMRDYTSITATTIGNKWLCKIPITTGLGDNLYNGNIRHVVLGLMDQTEDTIRNRATAYKHDQLQRLKETYNYFNWDNTYASITSSTKTGLREKVWYDANGNIDSLVRYDDAGTPALMDNFTYNYYGNINRLSHVDDAVSTGGISTDREDQNPNNYSYDEIGQLTADTKENIASITWNVRNKPTHIERTDKEIYFEYDEMGHRIKKEIQDGSENNWTQQWYVLDPQGNPIAVYEHRYTNPGGNTYNEYLDLNEHQLYGTERIGTRNHSNYHLWAQSFTCTSFNVDGTFNHPTGHTPITIPANSYDLHQRVTGKKNYEIKNHTNNIQAVVTDFKKPYAACTTGVANVTYYTADVISYTDYFVFGGVMNNRNLSSNEYRYGFQGQERDNEIKGNDNSINYEFRMHDPQYGRFLSIDPLAAKYPYWTPYQFSGNRLIDATELEGLEPNKNAIFKFNDLYSKDVIRATNGEDVVRYMIRADNNQKAYYVVYYNKNVAHYFEPSTKTWIGFNPYTEDEADADYAAATVKNINDVAKGFSYVLAGALALPAAFELITYSLASESIGTTLIREIGEEVIEEYTGIPLGGFKTAWSNLRHALKRRGLDKIPKTDFNENWSEGGYDYEMRTNTRKDGSRYYRIGRRHQGNDETGQGNGWEYQDKEGNWHSVRDLKKENDDKGTHHNLPDN